MLPRKNCIGYFSFMLTSCKNPIIIDIPVERCDYLIKFYVDKSREIIVANVGRNWGILIQKLVAVESSDCAAICG